MDRWKKMIAETSDKFKMKQVTNLKLLTIAVSQTKNVSFSSGWREWAIFIDILNELYELLISKSNVKFIT